MAEEKIEISVEFDGGEQAARELGQVSSQVRQVGTAAESSKISLADFARTAQSGAQRIQGVAGAVQSLVSAFGSENRTAGLVASIAGATAQFAAMGSMLGPAGTVVGGLVGLTSGLVSAYNASQDTAEGIREVGDAAASAEDQIRSFNAALEERARQSALDLGVAAVREYDEEIIRATASLEEMRSEFEAMPIESAGSPAERALNRRIRDTTARLEELRQLRSTAAEEEAAIMEETLAESAAAEAERAAPARRRGGGGGGGGRRVEAVEEAPPFDFDAWMESTFAATDAERDAWSSTLDDINGLFADSMAERERLREEEQDRIKEYAEQQIEIAHQRKEREQEIALEQQEQQAEMAERGRESISRQLMEVTDLANQTMMTLGKTIVQVIKGEQSAEQAFTGFLKSFLEMMSQYAGLKAAAEFAEAIGAFATQNYAGGGQHIAAGAAWTAVAIATGVGAAAINTAPSAPARPEGQSMGGAEGKGGEVVINWNSPVVTAGTYADLGRELQTAVEAAGSI